MPDTDRFTVKSGEALQSGARLAREAGHPEVAGVHLLSALLGQEEGIVGPVLEKVGIRLPLLRDRVTDELARYARVEGGSEPSISRDLRRAIETAEKEAEGLGDQYISSEHLLLGLIQQKDDAGQILKDAGVSRQLMLTALDQVRGSHRVMD